MKRSPLVLAVALTVAPTIACTKNSADQPASSTPSAATGSASSTAANLPGPAGGRTSDKLATSSGELQIFPVHHGTLALLFQGKTIFVDPFHEGNFEGLPKADVVLITDIHPDHLDPDGIEKVRSPNTLFVVPPAVAEKLPSSIHTTLVIKNGETKPLMTPFPQMTIEAVPMYNLKRGPSAGALYHDKGRGNGYVLTFGDKRVYLSGDTECTDEMRSLKNVDVAFVCMNLPYTMPPSEAAECIKAFRPKIVYPYHYRGSDLGELTKALAGESGIEVRMRGWY